MVLKARPKVFKTLLATALTISLYPIVPARAEESTGNVAESTPNETSCPSSADSADKCGEPATLSNMQSSNGQQSAFDIKSPAEAESQGNAIQAEYPNNAIVDWTKCGECEWMIDAEGCLIIRPRNNQDSGSLENWSKVPWREKASSIKSIRFIGTVSVPNAAGMFRYCNNAQSIDLNGLDTSCTTDMRFMFSDFGTKEMASVDLSPIDTSSVTDMTEMFSRSHIKHISLSLCNLEQVAYTNNMFEHCSVESIDMGDSHFASLIDASEMFENCSNLKSISLSSFTAPNLQLMPSLFEGCKSIQEIDLSAIGNNCVKSMKRAFRDCDSLRTISFGNFKSNKRISLWGAFLNDVSLRTISMSSLSSQPIDDISYAFKNCPSLEYVDISGIKTDDSTDTSYSFDSEKYPLGSFTLKVGSSFSFHTQQGSDVGPTASNDGLLTGRWVDIVSGKTFKRGRDITGPGTFVQQKELSRYTVSVDTQDEAFVNQAITKAIRSELVEGKDYTVNYSNNTNVGTAALTVKGINACAGQSVSFEFNIVQANPQFQAPSQIAVAYGQKTSSVALPEGFSWQSDDSHFTRLGTSDYLLTYTPQDSNYKTVRDIPISVTTSYLLTPDLFEIDLATETYDGNPKTKSILNPFIHEGEDYTVEYNDNVNAGNATIALTGINRYAGQHIYFNFNINKAVPNHEQNFTFDAKCDEILGNITLPEGYSWQASRETPVGSAGQHTFFVSYTPQDTNNYEVVRDIPVTINVTKYQLDKSQFNVDTQNETYTGSSILKQVNATVPDLEQGRDFHVIQTNNINAGTATIEIQGQGKYTGTLQYSFTILKADPTYSTPDIINATSGLKLKQIPLPHGFSWQEPETAINNPGDYTFLTSFTPQDIANYNVIRSIPVIVRATTTLSASMFTLAQSSFTYSGSAIEPAVRSAVVPEGSYTVEYRDNVCAGQAVAVITGAGGYTGSCELRFAIEKADPAYEAPGALDARYGQTLANLALPEGFSWQGDPGTPVGDPGEHQLLATFAPADEANYNVVRDIPVTVRVTRPVDASMFSVAQGPFPYSGSAIEPAVRSAVVPEGSYTVEYRDNVCAGQAVAVITGAGGYTGSCELRFAIEKADPAYEAPKKLIGTFGETLSSITLPDGFSWQDDPNTPIDWRGNKEFELSYTPTDTANYNTVRNIPITVFVEYDSVNIPTIAPFAYNGQLHKPTFDDDQRIAVLANNGGTDAGIYTATVALANPAFDRWVDGTVDPKTISYIISPADISSASIENIPDAVLEDGKAEPAVSALFNEKPLQSGKDFTVSYENNTQVGTGDVVISGTGNFTGITRLSFRVGLADISSCKPIIYDTPLVYQGEPVTPHVYLGKPNSGVTLHEGIDYEVTYSDNNAIGKATATLRGIGDYVGSTAIAFEIVNKLDLASMSCQVDNCAFYTGSPITQPVSVYRGRSSLSEGVDYTVTYENNINPGCATAVIHGIGNYTGEARCDFSIIRKADYSLSNDNAKLSLSGDNRYVYSYATNTFLYTGNSVTPQATVYLQVGSASIKLVEGIDYTVSYSNNNAIGTGFVTVTGINGLEGSVFGSFAISKTLPVSALNLSSVWDFDQIDYDLSGESPVKPKLIPSPYFVEGADYDLTYKDCNKIGTGFVSINGRGRYTGSVTLPVSIVAKHSRLLLQDCTVDTIPNQIYTGSPIRPSITMRNANGRILDNGLEYEPRFYNNVNVGTANVTVAQGAGFTTYDGYLQTSFNILPENIANTEIDPIPDQPLQKQAPKPDPRLTFNGKLLRENIDYEATYINNDKHGTATIAITGKGNFTGQTTTTFNVVEYEMPYDDVLTEFESKAVKWNDDEGQILKFSLPKGGAPFFIVNSVQGSYNAKAAILDEQANEIYSFDLQSQKQYGAMALPAGDYYLKIWGDTYNQAGVCVLHYGNGLYGQNDNCIYEKEDNCPSNGQTIADVATPVNLNSRFIGTAYMPPMSVDTDYYSFTLDKPMTIDLNFSANQSFRFDLVDDSGKTIEKADGDGYLSKMTYWGKEATVIMKCGVLKPGTYYVKVNAAMKEAIGSTYYCDIKTIASHWVSSNGRWWWQETDGSYPTSCWLTIDGKCYHFDSSGYMQTGWLKADGSWYWLGNDGAARTGWQQINGTWYWFENDGRMATGWQTIDAKRYLFASSGSMMTGWQQTGGSWYYLGGSGAMATGWKSIGGTWYWFNESGIMAIGWKSIGGTWYLFASSGSMMTGWQQTGGSWYYLGGSGAMATGWKSIGGTWYWFDQNGIMATGWFKPDESYYYANNSGAMQSNCWIGDYYLTSSGMMATNTWIGPYYVGPDGKWMR